MIHNVPKKYGIYLLTNKINNKIYIGKSFNLYRRINYEYAKGRGTGLIGRSIKKHGWDNFQVEILHYYEVVVSNDELSGLETAFIDEYKSLQEYGHGYNVCLFSTDRTGLKASEETKQKMSKALKGKYCGKNNKNYGKKRSPEQVARMTGENHPLYGTHRPDDVKKKLSDANLGKTHTQETKEKLSVISKATARSENHRKLWKKVKQIDPITNEIIKIWDSAADAGRSFNKDYENICNVCRKINGKSGKIREIAYGYKWEYV